MLSDESLGKASSAFDTPSPSMSESTPSPMPSLSRSENSSGSNGKASSESLTPSPSSSLSALLPMPSASVSSCSSGSRGNASLIFKRHHRQCHRRSYLQSHHHQCQRFRWDLEGMHLPCLKHHRHRRPHPELSHHYRLDHRSRYQCNPHWVLDCRNHPDPVLPATHLHPHPRRLIWWDPVDSRPRNLGHRRHHRHCRSCYLHRRHRCPYFPRDQGGSHRFHQACRHRHRPCQHYFQSRRCPYL